MDAMAEPSATCWTPPSAIQVERADASSEHYPAVIDIYPGDLSRGTDAAAFGVDETGDFLFTVRARCKQRRRRRPGSAAELMDDVNALPIAAPWTTTRRWGVRDDLDRSTRPASCSTRSAANRCWGASSPVQVFRADRDRRRHRPAGDRARARLLRQCDMFSRPLLNQLSSGKYDECAVMEIPASRRRLAGRAPHRPQAGRPCRHHGYFAPASTAASEDDI